MNKHFSEELAFMVYRCLCSRFFQFSPCRLWCRKEEDAATSVRLRIESGDESVTSKNWESAVLVAAGYDPYHLVDLAVAHASQLSGEPHNSLQHDGSITLHQRRRGETGVLIRLDLCCDAATPSDVLRSKTHQASEVIETSCA